MDLAPERMRKISILELEKGSNASPSPLFDAEVSSAEKCRRYTAMLPEKVGHGTADCGGSVKVSEKRHHLSSSSPPLASYRLDISSLAQSFHFPKVYRLWKSR